MATASTSAANSRGPISSCRSRARSARSSSCTVVELLLQALVLRLRARQALDHLVEALIEPHELERPLLFHALAIVAVADAREGGGQVLQGTDGARQRPVDEGEDEGAEDRQHGLASARRRSTPRPPRCWRRSAARRCRSRRTRAAAPRATSWAGRRAGRRTRPAPGFPAWRAPRRARPCRRRRGRRASGGRRRSRRPAAPGGAPDRSPPPRSSTALCAMRPPTADRGLHLGLDLLRPRANR